MAKYLITGGAGFIGSNITKKILENGDFARVLDCLSTGKRENIQEFLGNKNFELIEGDITNLETTKNAVKGIDVVFHEAALASVPRSIKDPVASNNANIIGTLNMLVAARDEGVKKFVYASSSSIYGDNPELPKKEDFPIMPISPYALTKYVGERYCQIFWKIYGLPTICLRYFNVFGPKQDETSQYSGVIAKFIKCFIKGETPVIFGTGDQSRDFTFIDNVVLGNLLAASAKEGNGEVFNIACQKQTSLNQLVEFLNEISGKNIKPEYQPERQGDVPHSLADISKANRALNYKPLVEFKEGFEKTFDWYKNQIKK